MRSTLELSKSRTKCLQSPQWLFMPSKCIQPILWSKRHLTARYLWCIFSLSIKSILILAHAMVILTSDTECIDDETCRYNGLCKDGKCICLPGYFGPGCQCKLILLKSYHPHIHSFIQTINVKEVQNVMVMANVISTQVIVFVTQLTLEKIVVN